MKIDEDQNYYKVRDNYQDHNKIIVQKISIDNEINFEKLLVTNLVIYFQYLLTIISYSGKYLAWGTAHSICNVRHKTPKEIAVEFFYGSNCGYHFIIKQLAE